MPLSRRPAERVSFGGHGYALPRNAFLRAGEAFLELIKRLPARLFYRDEHIRPRRGRTPWLGSPFGMGPGPWSGAGRGLSH